VQSSRQKQIPTLPPELLAQYGLDEDGSITFEELKEAVEKANNLT
jgi:Ca2+-binding EF-hand superfamily protein